MVPHPSLHWNEILAAYADGEFEGRDDLALLKQRVEEWLAGHPDAQAELAQIRQIKQLWRETAPPNPSPQAWHDVLHQLETMPPVAPPSASPGRRPVLKAAVLAACVAVAAMVWWWQKPPAGPGPVLAEEAPFSVAAAHEVEILNVEGADTTTLVVGVLPLQGQLELAAPGEVSVTSIQPAERDNMVPDVNVQGPGRPMIWARLDTD